MSSGLELGGLVNALGFDLVEVSTERVVIRWTVQGHHLQSHGLVHGGVHCAAVETVASIAAAQHSGGRVVGISNTTSFIRPVRAGTLRAVASPVHLGRTQQLWSVVINDSDDRLIAQGQVRLQNLGPEPERVRSAGLR